jgi:surface antigen
VIAQAMRRIAALALPAILLAVAPATALAVARAFWSELPVTYMNEQDRTIAIDRINSALDGGNDGETYRWENPATGASGSVTPKKSFTQDGNRCRSADFSTTAGGRKNAGTWKLCKIGDGWKIVD